MPTAGGLWLLCLQREHFNRYDQRCEDRERPGEANMLVQVSDIGAAHLGTSNIDLDEALHFEPSVGGAVEFKLIGSDKVLGRVEVKPNGIEAEIMVLDEHKAKAYASIKQGVEKADEGRVDRLAKRLHNIQQQASKECRWAHTTKTTHKDLAKVMIALRDTIEKWCFKTDGKADKLKTF